MPQIATPNLAPNFKNMTPSNGQVLIYNASTYQWEPGVPSISLDQLNDVNAGSPQKGQGIVWTGSEYQLRYLSYRIGSNAINVNSNNTTSEEVLHTWTIGANEFSTSARLRIQFFVETNNNANTKRFRVRAGGLAGTSYFNVNFNNSVCTQVITVDIYANGATNAQVGHGLLTTLRSGSTTAGKVTSSINTTSSWTIVLTSEKANGSDTLTILFAECYLIN